MTDVCIASTRSAPWRTSMAANPWVLAAPAQEDSTINGIGRPAPFNWCNTSAASTGSGSPSSVSNSIVVGEPCADRCSTWYRSRRNAATICGDPPYNTGNDFAYRDDFRTVVADPARGWVAMMRPRLEAARELLAETGAIFVSIDDNEAGTLRLLMDEVFGRGQLPGPDRGQP